MARVDLGLSDAEFGRLSPGELGLLTDRAAVLRRRADARIGSLASVMVRMLGSEDSELDVEAFVAELRALPDDAPPPVKRAQPILPDELFR